MAESCDSIVLCKEVHEQTVQEINYLNTLLSAGYNCNYLYTSRFIYFKSEDLKWWLENHQFFDGIILSNQHDVTAIYNVLQYDKTTLSSWQKLPAYCVGPAIANLAKDKLGIELCLNSETDNINDLAEIIISRKALITKFLLFPCCQWGHAPMGPVLSQNGIELFKIYAYRTVRRGSLGADVLNNVSTTPKIYVFFSPTTVDYFAFTFKKNRNYIKNVKAVAIDPTTEESLIKAKFVVYATAANPSPTALLEAINNAAWNSFSYTTM